MQKPSVNRILCLLLALLLCACTGASAGESQGNAETNAPTGESRPDTVSAETASPAPTPDPTPAPTPDPTPAPTPVPTPFSLAWLPDTQTMSFEGPEQLKTLGEEIAARREPDAIAAVLHSGDIVDNGWKEWQWDNFDYCLNALKNAGLPFYPVAGNHDIGVKLLRYDAYLERPFLRDLPAEQTYGGGKLYYIILNEGGVSLLLLAIGWDGASDPEALEWVNGVLETYEDLPCILLTHAFLSRPGGLHSQGRYLESKVIAAHPNIRIVLCGHKRGYFSETFTYDDDGDGEPDRTVIAMMLDNQSRTYLWRVLTFDPVTRSLTVTTHALGSDDPVGSDPEYGSPADFVIDNAF